MLKALTLENFKAFGSPTRIEFAPITLVFGENSAGKSSILQALNLLKQTHESRDSSAALLPRTEDGIVDLGSFNELLFDHDTDRVLRLGIEMQPDSSPRYRRRVLFGGALDEDKPYGVLLSFQRHKKTDEVAVSTITISAGGHDDLARFKTRPLQGEERRMLRRVMWLSPIRGRPAQRRQEGIGAQCEWVTDDVDVWTPFYKAWHARRSDVRDMLDEMPRHMERRGRVVRDVEEDDADESMASWSRSIDEAIAFYESDFTLSQFMDRMRAWAMTCVLSVDGFVPGGGPPLNRRELPEIDAAEMRPHRLREGLSLPLLDVGRVAFMAGHLLEESLDALFPMGPYRRPPERWYIFTGTSPIDVGYKGDHLPDLLFREPQLVDIANRWLRRLNIGYELKVRSVGDRDSDLFEVRLADTRRSDPVDVALSDVGFGISQILPFLVQSLATDKQLITIEQPEVHIHPRLQADLGDLLAECIREPYEHQFLIETHSEHLVLRLQKLVRNGTLKPSHVSIIYVSRGNSGSEAERLHLDETGDFVDEWPGGFFPERLRELQ